MATQNKVFIQIDNDRIELSGAELEAFNADRARIQAQFDAEIEAQTAKAAARQAVLNKIGLTADEAAALLGQFGNTVCVDRLRNNTRQHTYR